MDDHEKFFDDCDDVNESINLNNGMFLKSTKDQMAANIRIKYLQNDCHVQYIHPVNENQIDLLLLKAELDQMLDERNFEKVKIIAKKIEEKICQIKMSNKKINVR